jgi:hypothetical protein
MSEKKLHKSSTYKCTDASIIRFSEVKTHKKCTDVDIHKKG